MNLTQNHNLEGLRDSLLAPIEIIRDEDGYFYHPALPLTDENVNFKKLLAAFGVEAGWIFLEDDCTDKALLESVSDGGSCAGWEPSPPVGDGWVLLAIYDTEDGIIALFAREAPDTILPRRDETAVDRFTAAMKAKMASAHIKGRSGWHDPLQCTAADLSRMLRNHVEKGDPVDVANFAMMLHQRGKKIEQENVDLVESKRTLTCVYCGHEYPQETPAHGSQVLTDHIKVCERHPMRKAEAEIALLRSALAGMIGADTEGELRKMEAVMRMLPAPEADKAVSINAIHALLSTLPKALS